MTYEVSIILEIIDRYRTRKLMHFEKKVSFLKPKGNKYTTLIDIKSNDLLWFNYSRHSR
jgi:hypothetical protein